MSLDRQEYLAARIEYCKKKLKLGTLILEKVAKIQQTYHKDSDRLDEDLTEDGAIAEDLERFM